MKLFLYCDTRVQNSCWVVPGNGDRQQRHYVLVSWQLPSRSCFHETEMSEQLAQQKHHAGWSGGTRWPTTGSGEEMVNLQTGSHVKVEPRHNLDIVQRAHALRRQTPDCFCTLPPGVLSATAFGVTAWENFPPCLMPVQSNFCSFTRELRVWIKDCNLQNQPTIY